MKKKDRPTLAELRAMSLEDLWRGLFAEISTVFADANLDRYRAIANYELAQGLRSEDPVEAGSCKCVLTERMESVGASDIVSFILGKRENLS